MEIRKAVAGAMLGGGVLAMSVAGAGMASASPVDWGKQHQQPTTITHTTTVTKTKTVTVNKTNNVSGNVGNGISVQTASGNAGAIANVQLGLGAVSLPVSGFTTGAAGAGGSATNGDSTAKKGGETNVKQITPGGDQSASQDVTSVAKNNSADNSTKVNNANGNGNDSSVSISN